MMKKNFLFALAVVLCLPMLAQRDHQQQRGSRTRTSQNAPKGRGRIVDTGKHLFYLGLKGGLDITTMTQPQECDLFDGAGMGFSGGLAAKARFNKASNNAPAGTGLLGLGLELKYKQNKVKTIGTDESGKANADLSVNYFEVPVYVQVYPFYNSDAMNTFYVELGPDFAGTLGRSPKSLTVDNLTGDYSVVTYHLDDNLSTLKGFDVRFMAGIGYEFPIKKNDKHENTNLIGINARYYLGTSKLAKNFDSKMSTIELSLSWLFNIGKL